MFNAPRFVVYDFAVEETPATKTSQDAEALSESIKVDLTSLLTKLNYVLSDQKLSQDEFTLASKIFSAIGRNEITVEESTSEFSSVLKTTIQNLTEMKLAEYINLTKVLNSRFKIAIHFSSQYSETSSKIFQEDSTLIWIQTYSLEQIATQPHLKAEFWNYLKELKK